MLGIIRSVPFKTLIKRSRKKPKQRRFFGLNERIFAARLRVLDPEGKQIGVLSKQEALNKAKEMELDLVEIAPTTNPPVAKIIDFKKFLYQQEKKKREEKKKSKVSETKEVRLGPFMNAHDLEVMIRRAREFLGDGDKVKLVLRFQGRQITHPEFGQQTLQKTLDAISDISKVERETHFEGKQLIALVVPERKHGHAKEENQKISSETV